MNSFLVKFLKRASAHLFAHSQMDPSLQKDYIFLFDP